MDVHSGRIMGSCTDRRTQVDLVAFTEQLAQAYPKGRVHIVRDNLNTHRELTGEPLRFKHHANVPSKSKGR
jgi:hypothetical protein